MSNSCSSSHQCPSAPPSIYSVKYEGECPQCKCILQPSYAESTSTLFAVPPKHRSQKLDYNNIKLQLQKPSTITGENLYDHLVEIIKRIIDERPTNVIEYFEEFSRDVREKKFQVAERLYIDPYNEPQFLKLAEEVIMSLKVHFAQEEDVDAEENEEMNRESQITSYQSSDSSFAKLNRAPAQTENVIQLQHFWAFCGLGFYIDEVFHLSWAMQKIKLHYSVENVRFWGKIYGMQESYYIVEAVLTRTETENRFATMKANLLAKMMAFITRRDQKPSTDDIDLDLIPGTIWRSYSQEDLHAAAVPQLKREEQFEMPQEPVGSGLNRRTYFVTTSLNDKWQELPVVTPEQIKASRKIKKYFTGDLEANLACYPVFPGTEKHYLRAMIARITSGTYIAPNGYLRRMTRKERRLYTGEIAEEAEEGEYELESEDEEDFDNDALLTVNADYDLIPLADLEFPNTWVHVRPNILDQGRVAYIDEELAFKDLEKKAMMKMRDPTMYEAHEETEFELEEEGEEEELFEEEERPPAEIGPELFTPCSYDTNNEEVSAWTSRYSSMHNITNRMIVMRSNLWPGAFSFAFEKVCDSIYLGWGSKYVSRCISLENIPPIENVDYADDNLETTDPTVEMEEKWRLYHLKKEQMLTGEMSMISVEVDLDDEHDENDEP